MRRSTAQRHRTTLGFGGVMLTVTLVLAGCGSDDASSTGSTLAADTTLAPEDVLVDPAVVRAGLTQLPSTIAAAIAAIGTDDADAKLAAIQQEWFSIEGTIRATDRSLYLAIEDQLAPLQREIADGDSAAPSTAQTLSELFADYLAKYPE